MSQQLGDDAAALLRLAFNFAPANQRATLNHAIALRDAVLASARISEELHVCATQLAWWHDELRRMLEGNPRHPLSKALASTLESDGLSNELVEQWPVAAGLAMRGIEPDSENQWRIRAFRLHGTVLLLSCDDARQRRQAVGGFRDCAIALSMLDTADNESATTAALSVLGDSLATHARESDHVALAVLARLLTDAIETRRQARRPRGALSQLLTAWRAARACRVRSKGRPQSNDD